jgi:hypothetical protein
LFWHIGYVQTFYLKVFYLLWALHIFSDHILNQIQMIKLYKTVLLGTLSWLAVNTQAQNKLAFIYKNDSTEAVSYKAFLKGYGFETDLVEMQQIGNHDFSTENLIISGSNSSDTWISWGTDNDVATIKKTKKPILALCQGGSGLLNKLGHWNNGGNTAGNGFGLALKVLHPDDVIYNTPNKVTLNADSTFEPYTKTSCGNYLYTSNGYPSSIKVYDRSTVSNFKGYAGLADDSSKYFYLGYAATNAMTDFSQAGQDFFINLVYHAGQFNFVVTGIQKDDRLVNNTTFFPNPSKGVFQMNNSGTVAHVGIYNTMGNLVSEIEQPKDNLNLSHLKTGVYTAKVQYADKMEIVKLVIE